MNYPESLYNYYRKNPDFEQRNTKTGKKILYFVLAAICLFLTIFPSYLPIPGWITIVIGIVGVLYFGFSAYLITGDWYNKHTNGMITEKAIKKFRNPARGTVPGGEGDVRIMEMFANEDWAALANESAADDRPMQLYIHEDKAAKVFYLQLMRYFSSSDFHGITEVKVVDGKDKPEEYEIISKIRTT